MAYKDIEDKRAYHREYMRETRKWLKNRGYCMDCGKRDAFTLGGKCRCAECSERHSAYKRDRTAENEKHRMERERRRSNRLCTRCGNPLPTAHYPYVMCERCRASERQRQERQRREAGIVPKQLWRELGLCVRCGKPRLDGLTVWGGEEIKLCQRCYADTVNAAKDGRDSFSRSHGTTWGNYQYEFERLIRHGQKRENP